jgi:hypothetical protein
MADQLAQAARADEYGAVKWERYLRALTRRGWTVAGIAAAADVSRGVVFALMRGTQQEPSYAAGSRLLLLQSREPVRDRRRRVE